MSTGIHCGQHPGSICGSPGRCVSLSNRIRTAPATGHITCLVQPEQKSERRRPDMSSKVDRSAVNCFGLMEAENEIMRTKQSSRVALLKKGGEEDWRNRINKRDAVKVCPWASSTLSSGRWAEPQEKTVLSDALGVKGEVRKERRLFLIGQTRVHLDTVEGLGHYMELEVVMRPEQTVEEGQQVAEDLMEQLGVSQESLVTGAYMDLILKGQKET
ncbi:uncharacterized protein AKAME5_002111800 [Lates japonicus]|uniref:CYTH domain-containing protein n=1 Tax=Lates japonicus TaxID=270547 RepID=A0AAD3NEH4_LATJO|nr:uncharacterized protein AKAME5_002111800 [Lates japonicus]